MFLISDIAINNEWFVPDFEVCKDDRRDTPVVFNILWREVKKSIIGVLSATYIYISLIIFIDYIGINILKG